MRKMLNNKGFSLTELIIVLVVMGILAGISVPLYKAVTKGTHEDTCDTSIESIKNAASNYYAYFKKPMDLQGLKDMMDENGTIPSCPHGGNYAIAIDVNTGSATVQCLNCCTHADGEECALCDLDHAPSKSGQIYKITSDSNGSLKKTKIQNSDWVIIQQGDWEE